MASPDLDAARREAEAVTVLREIVGLIEDNTLVRDISGDTEPGWQIKALKLVAILARAARILNAATAPAPEAPPASGCINGRCNRPETHYHRNADDAGYGVISMGDEVTAAFDRLRTPLPASEVRHHGYPCPMTDEQITEALWKLGGYSPEGVAIQETIAWLRTALNGAAFGSPATGEGDARDCPDCSVKETACGWTLRRCNRHRIDVRFVSVPAALDRGGKP